MELLDGWKDAEGYEYRTGGIGGLGSGLGSGGMRVRFWRAKLVRGRWERWDVFVRLLVERGSWAVSEQRQ